MIKLRILEEKPVRINVLNQDVVGMTSPPIQYIARNIFPDYDGETEIVPKLDEETILHTADKIVHRDIVVRDIPIYKVHNASGGYTIYVAERMDE